MTDLARLLVRLVVGGLLAGHGAQKLFGWFEGPGPAGTAGMMDALELRPARQWALLAGVSELGGGLLTALGALNPLGPLGIIGSMVVATVTVHRDRPIWSTAGGAELPVTNLAVAGAIALVGPGRYSVDHALRLRLPGIVLVAGLVVIAATVRRVMEPSPRAAPLEDAATHGDEPVGTEQAERIPASV